MESLTSHFMQPPHVVVTWTQQKSGEGSQRRKVVFLRSIIPDGMTPRVDPHLADPVLPEKVTEAINAAIDGHEVTEAKLQASDGLGRLNDIP